MVDGKVLEWFRKGVLGGNKFCSSGKPKGVWTKPVIAMGEPFDLNEIVATQLDEETCEDTTDVVLPVAEGKTLKKRKYMSQSAPCKDMIKWVHTESGLVPFVLNNQTQVVHSGRSEMTVTRSRGHAGEIVQVTCIKGCATNCGEPGVQCQCLCHLLQEHYLSR